MTGKLPGAGLYRFLTTVVSEEKFHDFIIPTIADLQHEVLSANGNRRLRWLAGLRGQVALLRALVAPHPSPRSRSEGMRKLIGFVVPAVILLVASVGYVQYAPIAHPDVPPSVDLKRVLRPPCPKPTNPKPNTLVMKVIGKPRTPGWTLVPGSTNCYEVPVSRREGAWVVERLQSR